MTIFAKIIAGDIPCHKVWEDDNHLAFLDIRPFNKGHTLVIPKKPHDYIFDISAQEYQDLWSAAHKVATILKEKLTCKRVVTMVLGYEVHHTHIHLIPTESEKDVLPPTPQSMSHQDLAEIASFLRGEKEQIELPTTEQVTAMWDQFAPLFSEKHEPTTIRLAKSAMEHLELDSASRVLEVGGGAGASAEILRKMTPPSCEIVSTDISAVMQKIAIHRNVSDVTFQIADAQNLSFPDASFDRYFSNLNLMLITDPYKAIQEARRVLRKDGSIAVWTVWGRSEFSPMMTLLTNALENVGIYIPPVARSNFHLGTRTTLQNWLRSSGFHNITMWYQPMVVSFDDPSEFVIDFINNRRELQDISNDLRQILIDVMLKDVLQYRQRCEAISLDVLVVVAKT